MKLLDDIEKVVDDFCLDKEEQAEDIIDWATTISNFSELEKQLEQERKQNYEKQLEQEMLYRRLREAEQRILYERDRERYRIQNKSLTCNNCDKRIEVCYKIENITAFTRPPLMDEFESP